MDKNEALDGARRYCGYKEVCAADVRKKMSSWKIPQSWQEEILECLIRDGFLDESRYVRAYVHDKIWLNKWGRAKVRYMLRAKNIPEVMIDRELQQVDGDQYRTLLCSLLRQKDHSLSEKARLVRFASGRGFEYDIIMEVLNKKWND